MQRLYIETMEEILKNSRKVILDQSAEGKSGVVPYLPLPAVAGAPSPPEPASGNEQLSGGRSQ
jgi:membrane protease subunit HflK